MFGVLVNAWKVKDIRKKIIYTLLMILLVRLGSHIPLPGIDALRLQEYISGQGADALTLYNIIAGGSLANMTIFAMGIGPYITSSIIMQLLTIAIPKLEQMSKEGEDGRKKINVITRYVTVVLALIQSIGIVYSMHNLYLSEAQNFFVYIVSVLSLVAGTTFIMWIGEQITKKGVGNGTSLIIFLNIISNLKLGVQYLYGQVAGGNVVDIIKVIVVLILFVLIIAFAVLVQNGERRLPVQYSRKMVGRKMFGGQSSYMPIKVNIAGVISIIFAISLLQFPKTINQFVGATTGFFKSMIDVLEISHPIGAVLYVALIVFFTYFYTSIVFNPIEVAENMKKNGGFIPGIRPGQPTSAYITKVVNRITLVGALFYSIIALLPVMFQWVFNMNVGFGGTTLLIVVGVCLETVKQIESQLLMRHYKGFLNE